MRELVDERVTSGRYCDAGDYVRDLIRREQEGRARATGELRSLLKRGEESGVSPRTMDEIFDRAHRRATAEGLADD